MVEPHTPTSFKDPKSPILDAAFSADDEIAKTRALVGEIKQPFHKLNDLFDEFHDRTMHMVSLAGPIGTNSEIADLRHRLRDQDKDFVTEIHGIIDELKLLQSQYVANIRKEVERVITEQMDKLVQERVAEYLKARIPQELQDEVARSNREPPQDQLHPGSQLPHTNLPMSPRNPPSAPQGPSTPTLSHTVTSPDHLTQPSALPHSSNSHSLTSPPPTLSTPSISGANWLDVGSRAAAIKNTNGTVISLENSTKSTPTPSPETEDQLAEQEQNDKVEAAEKEKVEAEVADEIRKLEEAAKKEKERHRKQEEWLRKEVEARELQRLKEEEERRLMLKEAEEGILKAKREEEMALRLAQERANEEKERKEEEKREEQERLSKLAEETILRLEEEAAAMAKAEAFSEPEPEEREEAAHKGDGKQDGELEDGKATSINSPTSDKRRPGPLDLTSGASPVVAPLAAARFITDIATISYPEGCQGPHPDLNQNVKNGKFRYDPEFLLQFMSVCKERPAALPPLDSIGLKVVDHTHAMSRGGPVLRPSGAGQTSVGLGFTPFGKPGANNLFSVDEERYFNGTAASQGGAGAPLKKRVRTKRKGNRNENDMVQDGSGEQGHGPGFYSIMNQMQNLDPVAPLHPSENRWDPNTIQIDQDSPELVEQNVKGLLNELTVEKFDPISDQIIAWANMSEKEKDGRTLTQVIRLVFEKATDKAVWSEMYARLCRKMMEQISNNVQIDDVKILKGKPITGGQLFRKYLLDRCQDDFDREWVAKEATAAAALEDEAPKAANAKTKEAGTEKIYSDKYAAKKAKRQRLGLIKFIGELFKLRMLTERIMHECVKKFLVNVDNPEEEEIESLCMLLTTVGSMLDIQKARGHLDIYFSRIKEIMKSPNVTPRMQYMLQDLLELRERKWVASNAQRPDALPPIVAQMRESYQRQITISQGGSGGGGDRGEFNNLQQVGSDGWALAGSVSGPPRPPPKGGDLSNFGKSSRTHSMTFGPSSIFAGKKGAENKRESISRTYSSSNMFSMLSSQGAEAGDKDKVPAAAAEPHQQRKRLVLQPRPVPVDVASPAGESDSDKFLTPPTVV